ncbi:MAG: hypothetical protein P8N92_01345 [Burkholderiales bacterium]|jgi:hypothetical protein|nr:hypothetical protein [Burkholderiales bacterium]
MSEQKSNLIILDIGSHKLEELQTLLCPYPRQLFVYILWLAKQLAKLVLRRDNVVWKSLCKQAAVIKYYFLSRRKYDITIVAIEPNPSVALRHVARLTKKYRTVFVPAAVLGHETETVSELKILYSYDQSISSSLYEKNRAASKKGNKFCVGLKLKVIWDGLIREGIVDRNSEVILRMNCEGAELGVLLDCEDAQLHLKSVIGSIGDIEKIHGSASGDRAMEVISRLGIKYHYFKGDDPATWYEMVPVWDMNTDGYKVSE